METNQELEIVPDGLWLTPQARLEAAKAIAAGEQPPPAIQTAVSKDDVSIQT